MTAEEAVAQRVAPVGEVNMGGPKVAEASQAAADDSGGGGASALETGAEIYDAVCSSCHAQGIAGAPQTGTTDVWQQRLDDGGLQTLYDNAINGINAMPAKGGMSSLSNEQVQQAVDYILGESGLEPESSG
jgi:cytochrome c5